jgi:acyl dehydratase
MTSPVQQTADLKPGAVPPPQVKTFGAADLVMYGAATWDWHRLHHDRTFAEAMNLPAPVIDGQIYGALFAKQVVAWLGPRAFVRRLNFRMRAMAFAGDTLMTEGEVTEVRIEDSADIVVLKQRLTCGARLVSEATTEVRLPREISP